MDLSRLAFFLLLFSLAAAAQEAPRQSAAVVIANRTVIVLRGPIAGYSAEERVRNAIDRIETALDADPYARISFDDSEAGTRVLLGETLGYIVTKIDIDSVAGETPQILAKESAKRLERAIVERREQHSLRYLAIAAAYAAGASAVYAALLWLLVWGSRRLSGYVSLAAEEKVRKLQIGNVRVFATRAVQVLAWLLALTATVWWLAFVLQQFPYTRRWGEDLQVNLLDMARQIVLAILGALPGLAFAVVIFFLARVLIRVAGAFFDRVEQGTLQLTWLDTDTARPTRRIFSIVVWVFALAMAYPFLPGAGTDAFKGLSVLVGLMLSLGGASVIGQAFSGIILMYMRIFRRGDYVRIGDTEGTVTELGMFATRIRTGMGEEIAVSNSTVLTSTTKNYSRAVPGTGIVVLDTVVTIGYSTPWRQVEAMLREAARRTDGIAHAPEPLVRQTALSDFYAEYRLIGYSRAQTADERTDIINHLHGHIQDVFNEYGVQITSPHYMLEPKQSQVVPKEHWYAPPAQAPSPADARIREASGKRGGEA
ncbi:MAG TPA: mechanosensitive ion channel domain-containing protein [Burkholderiales bacterium]